MFKPAIPSIAAAYADGGHDRHEVTIAHGPLTSLGMGAMTTAFKVRDPAMLKSITPGQEVRFATQQVDGAYTVTRVETVPR